MTSGSELRALNAMNNFGLWLASMNLGHDISALDAVKSSRL